MLMGRDRGEVNIQHSPQGESSSAAEVLDSFRLKHDRMLHIV